MMIIFNFYMFQDYDNNIMKNIELYRTIEALVQAKRQQYQPNKPSFAHEYCRQQIKRKRLIPHNPNSKMNRIMKNFHQLDTYVDVQQLFEFINAKVQEKKKQDITKSHTNIKWKSKQNIPFNDDQIIKKVREKLGPYNYKIYMKDLLYMRNIIGHLEQQSSIATQRKNNCSSSDDLIFYLKYTEPKKISSEQKQQNRKNLLQKQIDKQKQKWQFYQGNNYIMQDSKQKQQQKKSQYKQQIQKLISKKANLRQRQQRKQLIHQVSTYLQIILQNQHKKKWGKKQIQIQNLGLNVTNQNGQKLTCNFTQKGCNQNLLLQTAQSLNQSPNPSCQTSREAQSYKKHRNGFRIQRRNTRHTQHKSQFVKQKKNLLNSSIVLKKQNSCQSSYRQSPNSEASKFLQKKFGVKENFTFRNRNIKQNLMRKVQQFLQYVQFQQKQFKKQKHTSINELNYIQNKQNINSNNLGDKSFIVDDQQLRAVQNIVHMQK